MALRRIVVVGSSCAGKTTFARALAKASGSTCIELDALYWGPNWQPKSPQEFRRLVVADVSSDCWVADGNYRPIREVLWPRATAVIWLNCSYSRVLWQALRRTVTRVFSRQRLWHGNRESVWRSFFSRESLLLWIEFSHPKQARHWLMAHHRDCAV